MAPYIQYTKSRSNENIHTYIYTQIDTKRLLKKKTHEIKVRKQNREPLEELIDSEAFVIQHETEYDHCWTDRDIGRIG